MARGISLHVGLNTVDPTHYGGWDGALRACEFDARDMEALARGRGFEPTVLLTSQGTAEAVTAGIRRAAQELDSGDFFFLTYSGHGGQVPDKNSDDEADEKDETWVLYDRQLVDDELYALWAEFRPGVRVFILSDSCHSGSVARDIFDASVPHVVRRRMVDDEQPRTKDLPPDVERRTYEANQRVYDELQGENPAGDRAEVAATVILISGCQDNQLSLDGSRNGLFTQQLLSVWDEGRWQGGYQLFRKAIGAKMPPTQSPNYLRVGAQNDAFEAQTPLAL